jgi:hypothetical protein
MGHSLVDGCRKNERDFRRRHLRAASPFDPVFDTPIDLNRIAGTPSMASVSPSLVSPGHHDGEDGKRKGEKVPGKVARIIPRA